MSKILQSSPKRTTDTPTKVSVFAEYQLFSDLDSDAWWEFILDECNNDNSIVTKAELVHSVEGVFGLRYLYFTAEFFVAALDEKAVKRICKRHLNTLVGDTDVKIHHITAI